MSNTPPVQVDFLSDTSNTVAAINRIETALQRLGASVTSLNAGFSGMNAAATSANRLASALNAVNTAQQSAGRNSPIASNTNAASAGKASGLGRMFANAASLATIGALAKAAANRVMDFEQAMAGVAAVGEIDKASLAFQKLTDAAFQGSKAFNAIEKAGGLRELIAAGMSAEQATGSLSAALQLATAGEMSMSSASEILVASMSAFGFKAKDTTKIVDTLTAAANASPASISDMGESMKFIAPIARSLKISIGDTSAALAILANNGVKGGMAGRGLGAVFARMVAPTKDAQEAMAEFGLEADKLNPSVVGLETSMRRLATLDQKALVKLFGAENLDISSLLAQNAAGFGAMADKMRDAEAAAGRYERAISNTASGSMKKLKNAFVDLEIVIGRTSTGPVKSFVDSLTTGLGYVSAGYEEFARKFSGEEAARDLPILQEKLANLNKQARELSSTDSLAKLRKDINRARMEASNAVTVANDTGGSEELIKQTFALYNAFDRLAKTSDETFAQRIPKNSAVAVEALMNLGRVAEKQFSKMTSVFSKPIEMGPLVEDGGSPKTEDRAAKLREALMNNLLPDIEKAKKTKKTRTKKEKENDFMGVADSMQSIGGGGNYFGVNPQDKRSAVQEAIRDGITETNKFLAVIAKNSANTSVLKVKAA